MIAYDHVMGVEHLHTDDQLPAPLISDTAHDDDDSDTGLPEPEMALILAQACENAGKAYNVYKLAHMMMIGDSYKMEEVVCLILGWIRSGDMVVEGHEDMDGYDEKVILAAIGGSRLRLAAK